MQTGAAPTNQLLNAPPGADAATQGYAGKDAATVVAEAKKGFAERVSADEHNRTAHYEDIQFRIGKQWHAKDEQKRLSEERPVMTINRIPQIVNQVIGDIRRNRPSIQVSAGDAVATPRGALVTEGLIRSIERASKAHDAYIGGGEQAVIGGIGHWRIAIDWADEESFDLEAKIVGIENPFSVVRDADGMKGDGEHSKKTWVYEEMDADLFKATYPDAVAASWPVSKPRSNQSEATTRTPRTVTVCEYWCVEETPTRLVKIVHDKPWFDQWGRPQPATGAEQTLVDPTQDEIAEAIQMGFTPVAQRPGKKKTVLVYLLGGNSVLKGPVVWPGQRIPIFSVKGQEVSVGDITVRHGLVRFAKDAQRMFNYARSSDAELYGLSSKVPFIIADEQIQGFEDEWFIANKTSLPYLRYKLLRDSDGTQIQAPKPGREPPVSSNPGLMAMAAAADDDIKSTTGIYNASLGAPSSETSGVAIDARDRQADTGTFVYVDNLMATIEATGRELVNLIPKLYSTRRQIRILGRDDAAAIIEMANEPFSLDRGRYDVVVSTGPAHATARKEAAEGMMKLVEIVEPPFRLPLITRVMKAQDWHEADQLTEEFKAIAAALGMPGSGPPGMPPGAPPGVPPGMAPPGAPMASGPGGVPNIPGIEMPPGLLAPVPLSPGAAPAGFERVAPQPPLQGARG